MPTIRWSCVCGKCADRASTSAAIVGLGLFTSAAGIFTRALVLVGSGLAAGNLVILAVTFGTGGKDLAQALPITSDVMLTIGLLACVGPARRALRIQPADALKQA
jgi:ABC-type antimicrobial peptide transport system permease subunit